MRLLHIASICLVIVFAACQPSLAEEARDPNDLVKFDFRGMKMGDPMPSDFYKGKILKWGLARKLGVDECELSENEYVGSMSVRIAYGLIENRFEGVLVYFDSKDHDQMIEALTVKFGKPHKRSTETIHNRMGASFTNNITVWHTDSGDLVVEKYLDTVSSGAWSIFSKEARDRQDKVDEQRAKDDAKDL